MDATRLSDVPLLVRARRTFIPLIILMVISAGLQLAGILSPGWYIINYGTTKVYIGLWMVQYCDLEGCHTKNMDRLDHYGNLWNGFTEYRVETIFGLLSIAFTISAAGASRHPGRLKTTAFCVIITSLISGILSLVAAGKFANENKKLHDQLRPLGGSPLKFPYSVLLTGLGGIFACIISLVSLGCVRPWIKGEEPVPAYQLSTDPSIQFPVQGVSQAGMTPAYIAQSYPAHTYAAQSYPSQLYPAQHYPAQLHSTQSYPAQQFPVQPYHSESHMAHSIQGPAAKPHSVDDHEQMELHVADDSENMGNFPNDRVPIVP